MDKSFVRSEMLPEVAPPMSDSGVVGWMRKNLFSSPFNTVLTLIAVYLLWVIFPPIIKFGLLDAVWSDPDGTKRLACLNKEQGGDLPSGWFGACWPFVAANMKLFIYGRYPFEELWRVNLVYLGFFGLLIPLMMPSVPHKWLNAALFFGVFPVVALVLLTGGHFDLNGFMPFNPMTPGLGTFVFDMLILTGILCGIMFAIARGTDTSPAPGIRNVLIAMAVFAVVMAFLAMPLGLEHVETDVWGGLLVTLVIAVTGIVASLPLGILLALGRRSQMPAVRLLSVIFIEFWRGVPLITVLFMSSVMLPLFLPTGTEFDKLLRALIGGALFTAAYMAEVIRGGIQALPKGQYEGAMALGLTYWQMMRMIILPQALKLVIPGIVNSFIALFKDTTLVLIIGLFDFLGQMQSTFTNAAWATPVQSLTGYLFAALVFWFFCFSMSRYSIFVEDRLDTGHRS